MPDIRDSLRSSVSGLGSVGSWVRRQASGTISNLRGLVDYLSFNRLFPPSVVSTMQFFASTVPVALGLRGASSKEQFAGSTTLVLVAIVTSTLTFGLTLVAVVFFGFFWLISLARTVPAVNDAYESKRSLLPDTSDWRWER
jgi:hypothetical protein